MIDVNVLLLDAQKTYIGVVWNVGHDNICHQQTKKSQQQQDNNIQYGSGSGNLFKFKKRTDQGLQN